MKVYRIQLHAFLGYVIILAATILVLAKTLLFVGLNWEGALLVLLGLLFVFGSFQAREKKTVDKISLSKALVIIFACSLGSLITYYLNISKGLGPFMASGLVGIVIALTFPKLAPCVYSATFSAMSSADTLPTIFHSLIAGIIVGIVFITTYRVFNGFGGKLGVIAFFSVWLVFLVIRPEIGGVKIPNLIQGLGLVLCGMVGSIVTYILSLRMRFGPVLASSLIALAGGLFLPFIFPSISESLASALTAGSYAGMSSKEIVSTNIGIGLAGIIAGTVLVFGLPVFYGLGGKLGVVAFIGATCIWALKNLFFRKSGL